MGVLVADRRRPGRPKDSPRKHERLLVEIAERLCRREHRTPSAAAQYVATHFHPSPSKRQLQRLYAGRCRELEISAMRKFAQRMGTWSRQGVDADNWWLLVEQASQLAGEDERVARLAKDISRRPFRRWYPAELEDLLAQAKMLDPN